jgi:hypothetical protein
MIRVFQRYKGFDMTAEPITTYHGYSRTQYSSPVCTHGEASEMPFEINKRIDEFIERNKSFQPFWVRVTADSDLIRDKSKVKILGLRSDNMLVGENEKGEQFAITRIYEEDYILEVPGNDQLFAEVSRLEVELDKIEKRLKAAKRKINAPKLSVLKKTYIK